MQTYRDTNFPLCEEGVRSPQRWNTNYSGKCWKLNFEQRKSSFILYCLGLLLLFSAIETILLQEVAQIFSKTDLDTETFKCYKILD